MKTSPSGRADLEREMHPERSSPRLLKINNPSKMGRPSWAARGIWLLLLSSAWALTSCTNSRPDLVWSEDGRQFGKASWYDDHGERTANGEIYNMHALTAAHPSLALNSIVEVVNLENGRKVRVRINDRLPPIHDGRIIDLSPTAFRKLDSLSQGLMDVEVRVIAYGNNKYVKTERSAPSGKLFLINPKKNRTARAGKSAT